jgi:ribosomal protein L7/L12
MVTGIIQFQGSSFSTARDEITGVIYLAMKPFVEAIGLSWKAQRVKLNGDNRFSLKEIEYQTNGGIQKMLSLATDHLPAYLYSINPNKLKEELKSRIIAFQLETFEVINSYWRNKNLGITEIVETQTDRELKGLEFTFKHLRPSEASKIGMTKRLFKELDLKTSYLPEYSDEEHTFSAKTLLEKFEIKISVQQFNKKMIYAGFLETKTRKSSKYKTEKDVDGKEVKIPILKEFKSLTEKGLEFGKNMISPKNQLESQPHYFENRFSELLKILQI